MFASASALFKTCLDAFVCFSNSFIPIGAFESQDVSIQTSIDCFLQQLLSFKVKPKDGCPAQELGKIAAPGQQSVCPIMTIPSNHWH